MKGHEIFTPWETGKWEAVDDRVRGGSSRSHLDEVKYRTDDGDSADTVAKKGHGRNVARFWGTLDTKTLGGAGFASQQYAFTPTPLNLSRARYQGLCIDVARDTSIAKDAPHLFTIVLNSSTPPYPDPRPTPGPRPSSLTYEVDFSPKHSGMHQICIPWQDFKPVYRGREVPRDDPKWEELKTDSIFKISLMFRSMFAKQEGDFGLYVQCISGWPTEKGKMREGCWSGLKRWVGELWSGEGKVRLSDEKQ